MSVLLAFGGPWNEDLVWVADGQSVVLTAAVTRPSTAVAREESSLDVDSDVRMVTYRVERVGIHYDRHPARDDWRCRLDVHGDWCTWVGRCLVADGYPVDRITDQVTAIFALSTWSWLFGPVVPKRG